MDAGFSLNYAEISFNHFDDEIIVINLRSGVYFSLRATAALLWVALEQGIASARSLLDLFDAPPADAVIAIAQFLDRLEKANLIVPAVGLTTITPRTGQMPFTAPTLEAFDDLQELLLADIIHDTDENGWPNLAVQDPDAHSQAA